MVFECPQLYQSFVLVKIGRTRNYLLCGYIPSPSGAVKDDNVVERILVCRDPNRSQGDGTPMPNANGSTDGREI